MVPGFFALRTPVLPLDEFLAWGSRLDAPRTLAAGPDLERALDGDRARLRERLREVLERPEVREAVFVASPTLEASIASWLADPDGRRGRKAERALVRYFARMAGRATPFGLFAGCSVGSVGERTRLELAARVHNQRRTRLDMDYLHGLVDALVGQAEVRRTLRYRPNSSLYRLAGRVRYVESRLKDRERSHHLVAVEDSEELDATLTRAQGGATPAELADALTCPEISPSEAASYVEELIDSQVLVPDLELPVTGPEPIDALVEQLRQHPETSATAEVLEGLRSELAAIDSEGAGVDTRRYRGIAGRLETLSAKVELPTLFQVDTIKPSGGATLGRAVLEEIARGVEVLRRLTPATSRTSELERIAQELGEGRYEGAGAPLVELLDEEIGAGLGAAAATGSGEPAPLLAGLAFPAEPEPSPVWTDRERLLLEKLSGALQAGSREIALERSDLERLHTEDRPRLPDAFAVMAVLVASSQADLDAGRFRVLLEGASGPSGARLLGRFCHADPVLRRHVEEHVRAEEAHEQDAVFAEIAHLPEGRLGNILYRPLLREYEIPYLGRSGAPADRQIPVTDLHVSREDGRIVLRSARLGRRVIPRLTTAHNYSWRSLGLYRFLSSIQDQGTAANLGFDWGPLESAPFLPRVTSGRLVLSRARWRLGKDELERLAEQNGAALYRTVQELRGERALPRLLLLTDGDNTLPVDLDNVLSVESFVQLVKGRNEAVLAEFFPGPDELCAHGPEGRYVHELVVPFVSDAESAPDAPSAAARWPSERGFRRAFPPGSEWLYAKLYTGTATADRVLQDALAPLVDDLLDTGAVDGWFFIRYADPHFHLRLRFRGEPDGTEVRRKLEAAAQRLFDRGLLWRFALDTYEREITRYGGPLGVELAERFFQADSEAVLELLGMFEGGDAGADERWRIGLAGAHALLVDLGLDVQARHAHAKRLRKAFGGEFRVDAALGRQLGERFRNERQVLLPLLDLPLDGDHPLEPGFRVLRARSERMAPVVKELRAAREAGELTVPMEALADSYVHMFLDRLFRSANRQHELVIYDFLARLYESRAASDGSRLAGRRCDG